MTMLLTIVVFLAAFLFGGGTRAGFLGDVLVQLLAIPLLAASFWSWINCNEKLNLLRRSTAYLLVTAAGVFLMILFVQLVPLPASWFAEHFSLSAETPAWRQLSLAPAATWAAAISVVPFLAVFAGVSQLDATARLKFTLLVVALGALGLCVGFLQVAQGPESSLRFFEFTNPTEAVGFFANRNHFSAQLYTTLIFAAVWFAVTARDFIKPGAINTRAILWIVAATVMIIASIAGLALARSRAGIFLALAAIAGIVGLFLADGRFVNRHKFKIYSVHSLAVMALSLGVLFAAQFGIERILSRFETDPLNDLRVALTPATLKLAFENLPFGTGLGSFVPVYANAERAGNLFSGFANRAHNDWAEFLLETGLLGVVVVVLFLSWFAVRVVAVWGREPVQEFHDHQMLQRAATLAIALLLAHSLVDYPLRTTSLAVFLAFACAILIQPPKVITTARVPSPRRSTAQKGA